MTTAVYAGSFDPVTKGHLDLIQRAAQAFDHLIVAVGINSAKKPLFTTEEKIRLIEVGILRSGFGEPNIVVTSFEGLLVDFCKQEKATVIIRGLRAVTDFEFEMGIAHANRNMDPGIDTFFIPTQPKYSFVSSSTVREIAKHQSPTGWVHLDSYVTANVKDALKQKFGVREYSL